MLFMKRILLTTSYALFMLSVHLTVCAQGFRSAMWGETQANIIKKEGKPLEQYTSEEGHVLVYKRPVANKAEVITAFICLNNRLRLGRYIFVNLNRREIRELYKSLSEKYGKSKRFKAIDDHSTQYQWLKNDTRVTLNEGVLSDYVVNYYQNAHYLALENNYKKKRREGL